MPPRTAASAWIATRIALTSGCALVSATPAVCVWKRSRHAASSPLEPLAHEARPEPPRRAELRDLLEEVHLRGEEERHPRRDLRGRHARLHAAIEVGEPVPERERHLLARGAAGLAHVVAGDGDRVPARHRVDAEADEVGREAERRLDGEAPGVARDELLQQIVLHRAAHLVEGNAAALRDGGHHRDEDRRGRVDRHGDRHAVERDAVEDRLHVAEGVDRHAHLADLALGARVVAVVADLRRQVERDGEPGLAALEQVAEAAVGLGGGGEAGVLPHRPGPAAVHRGLHAARERELAREADLRGEAREEVGGGHRERRLLGARGAAERRLPRGGLRHGALPGRREPAREIGAGGSGGPGELPGSRWEPGPGRRGGWRRRRCVHGRRGGRDRGGRGTQCDRPRRHGERHSRRGPAPSRLAIAVPAATAPAAAAAPSSAPVVVPPAVAAGSRRVWSGGGGRTVGRLGGVHEGRRDAVDLGDSAGAGGRREFRRSRRRGGRRTAIGPGLAFTASAPAPSAPAAPGLAAAGPSADRKQRRVGLQLDLALDRREPARDRAEEEPARERARGAAAEVRGGPAGGLVGGLGGLGRGRRGRGLAGRNGRGVALLGRGRARAAAPLAARPLRLPALRRLGVVCHGAQV